MILLSRLAQVPVECIIASRTHYTSERQKKIIFACYLQQFSQKLGNIKLYFWLKLQAKFTLLEGCQDKIEYIIIMGQNGASCRDKKE